MAMPCILQMAEKKWRGENGAGRENRTLMISLEGWSFTIKLYPLNDGQTPRTAISYVRSAREASEFQSLARF